jgi:hypothetical protein
MEKSGTARFSLAAGYDVFRPVAKEVFGGLQGVAYGFR